MSSRSVLAAVPTVPGEVKPGETGNEKPVHSAKSGASKPARRPATKAKAAARERYFLATRTQAPDVSFSVGREVASESDAVVEAFREQTSFFVVTEWRVGVQVTGTTPQLVKEGVARTEKA